MGIAMVFVMLLHMSYLPSPTWLKHACFYLYIGVDIFICASGFGLCYAWNKQGIERFYKRRFLRLYPTYALMALFVTFLRTWGGEHFSTWDIFCHFTTLQYYNIGGHRFDWYLSAMFVLYLIFPLLFKLKHPLTCVGIFVCTLIFLHFIRMNWPIPALIGRIGIFAYGILMYRVLESQTPPKWLYICGGIFCLLAPVPFLITHPFGEVDFIFSAGLTPLLLAAIFYLHHILCSSPCYEKAINLLSFIGKYSLPLYAANILVDNTQQVLHIHSISSYWVLQALWSTCFILLENKVFSPCINKWLR